jgi:hypothetical protein
MKLYVHPRNVSGTMSLWAHALVGFSAEARLILGSGTRQGLWGRPRKHVKPRRCSPEDCRVFRPIGILSVNLREFNVRCTITTLSEVLGVKRKPHLAGNIFTTNGIPLYRHSATASGLEPKLSAPCVPWRDTRTCKRMQDGSCLGGGTIWYISNHEI